MIYVRQDDPSYLHPTSIQKLLKDIASMKFKDSADSNCVASEHLYNNKEVSTPIFIDLLCQFCNFCWKHNKYYEKFQRKKKVSFEKYIDSFYQNP